MLTGTLCYKCSGATEIALDKARLQRVRGREVTVSILTCLRGEGGAQSPTFGHPEVSSLLGTQQEAWNTGNPGQSWSPPKTRLQSARVRTEAGAHGWLLNRRFLVAGESSFLGRCRLSFGWLVIVGDYGSSLDGLFVVIHRAGGTLEPA